MILRTQRMLTFCLAVLALLAAPALAQDEGEMAAAMEAWQQAATPGPEHQRLAEQVGTWKVTVKNWVDPAAEPMVSEGTAERAMILDGRVLEEHFQSTMMGQPFRGYGLTGYDNVSDGYWATWNDTMSTGLTVMRGGYSEGGETCTFEGDVPDPMAGGTSHMKIVTTTSEGGDREVHEFYMVTPEGEVKGMELVYVRQ